MNEINNVVEELSYIRQEFEKLNKTLLEIKALLTPTNLTVSQEYIDEEVKKITYTKGNEKEGLGIGQIFFRDAGR